MSIFFRDRGRFLVWIALVGAAAAILGGALAPPFLSYPWDTLVMHAFAPVCHQISGRSPHIGEIQIALCDRCTGIYFGVLVGVLGAPLAWRWRDKLFRWSVPILLGPFAVMSIDWIGPVVGLWPNVPLSRFVTGGLLGSAAGILIGVGLLRSDAPPARATSENQSPEPA